MEVVCPYDLTSLPALIGIGIVSLGLALVLLTLRSIVRSRTLPPNTFSRGVQIVGLVGGVSCLLFGFDLATYQEVRIVELPVVHGQELVEQTCKK